MESFILSRTRQPGFGKTLLDGAFRRSCEFAEQYSLAFSKRNRVGAAILSFPLLFLLGTAAAGRPNPRSGIVLFWEDGFPTAETGALNRAQAQHLLQDMHGRRESLLSPEQIMEDSLSNVLLEVCCGSLDDAIEAEKGGAERVELCSCLFLGGLTPSIGSVIEAKRRLKIPIIAMIRPRGGGFRYTEAEFAAMQHDARASLDAGAAGIVFGILKSDGTIDVERNRVLREIAGKQDAVFHRAIDVTPDPFRALEQLIDLGFTRVLTSGQQDSVPEGLDLIRQLVLRAGNRIQIMPGGGIKPHAVADILRVTGCKQIHVAAWKPHHDPSCETRPQVTFGGALYPPENRYDVTDRSVIAGIAETIRG